MKRLCYALDWMIAGALVLGGIVLAGLGLLLALAFTGLVYGSIAAMALAVVYFAAVAMGIVP